MCNPKHLPAFIFFYFSLLKIIFNVSITRWNLKSTRKPVCRRTGRKKLARNAVNVVFLCLVFFLLSPPPLFSLLPLCLLDLLDPLLGALSPPSDSSGSVIGCSWREAGLVSCSCCFSSWWISFVVSFGNSQTSRTAETDLTWGRCGSFKAAYVISYYTYKHGDYPDQRRSLIICPPIRKIEEIRDFVGAGSVLPVQPFVFHGCSRAGDQ